jgi:hypothetical protein
MVIHPMCTLCDLFTHRKRLAHRALEAKSRTGIGGIELTENEWSRACNLRDRYWLYVVFECGTPNPRLLRVENPFMKLLANAKGGVIIREREIFSAAEAT